MGKTSLLGRIMKKKFVYQYKATIGADFQTREVEFPDKVIVTQVWDTAGQERYHSLGATFYKGSECCFLVYDITNLASFEALGKWRTDFLQRVDVDDPNKFPFIVIGNKSDKDGRKVSKERARGWALGIGAEFFEVSARDSTNVEDSFMACIDLIQKKVNAKQHETGIDTNKDKPSLRLTLADKSKSKSCC